VRAEYSASETNIWSVASLISDAPMVGKTVVRVIAREFAQNIDVGFL
jgi:hypothetical protein